MRDAYDLVVIGSGPAGEKGATQAASCGKRVAVVERAPYLGGAGINTGTIPSKTLRETALYFSGLRQRGLYGIDYSLREGLTVQHFLFRERAVVETERRLAHHNFAGHDIDVLWGHASIKDAHTVVVRGAGGETELTATIILIASGSSPRHPPGIPFAHPRVHDSDEILFDLDRIPETMAVVGGGVIGCEYASIFTALGVRVTLIESGTELLPFVDEEIARRLRERLEELGLCVMFDEQVTEALPAGDHVTLVLESGARMVCDIALWAAGRQSNIAGLGLEALGVELGKRGLIIVDETFRTSLPSIYAAGDVIGFPALASTSMEQGRVAVMHAFDLPEKERISPVIPLAVYTIPEIAMAGLTEQACRQQNIPYLTGRAHYKNNSRGQIIGDTAGMLKLVFSPKDKTLLGVHHIGELASELVHIGLAVVRHGGTIDEFTSQVWNYPTLADTYKYAAHDGLRAWAAHQ